jgi:hypothetical protein
MRLVGVIGEQLLRVACLITVTRPQTARQSDTAAPPNALLFRARAEQACLDTERHVEAQGQERKD